MKQYCNVSSIVSCSKHAPFKLCLLGSRQTDGRIYNIPSASKVAALLVGDFDESFQVRDIIVEEYSVHTQNKKYIQYKNKEVDDMKFEYFYMLFKFFRVPTQLQILIQDLMYLLVIG